MTDHLSPEEFADALSGSLATSRREHLSGCPICETACREALALAAEVGAAASTPEPSPFFWEQLSRRIAADIGRVERPASWRAWVPSWRLGLVLSGLAALLAAGVWRVSDVGPAAPIESVAGMATVWPVETAVDSQWAIVRDLAVEFDAAAVRDVVVPQVGTADVMIDQLTASEREAFVRLLRSEMGELQ
jgi:hypothetical protein